MQSTGQDFKAIVIADKPSGAARLAAEELQHYLSKVTGGTTWELRVKGVTLPILSDSQTNIPTPAILVGRSKYTDALGIDLQKLDPEGFVLKSTNQYLVIAGNDHPAWTYEVFQERNRLWTTEIVREAGTRVGTLFGVYTFLQDFVGVGWYLLNDPLGEVVPTRKDVAVPAIDRVEAPAFSYRWYKEHPYSLPQEREINRRMRFRMRLGCAAPVWASHTMPFWGNLFGKEHPEYFQMIDGKRLNDWGWTGNNFYGCGRDFCWANPATIRQQVEEMRLYFKGETDRAPWVWVTMDKNTYPIGGNDWAMQPCQCELCGPWVVDPAKDYHASQSDLFAYHLREVAKVAASEYPDKRVIGLAYGPRVKPSRKLDYPKNVLMCLAFVYPATMDNPTERRAHDELMAEWLEKVRVPSVWLYTDIFRQIPFLPLALPHAVAREIQRYKGKVGGFFFSHSYCPGYDDLEVYLATQLMWNPDQDVEALIERFMKELYGPAAPAVRETYAYLESLWVEAVRTDPPRDDKGQAKYENILHFDWNITFRARHMWTKVFTAEKLFKAVTLMESARAIAAKHLADTRDDLPLMRVQRLEEKIRASWTEAARISYDRMLALQKAAMGPALTCPRLDDTVVLDGSLTEGAWSRAFKGEMTNIADKGPRPACATRLSVWRDAEHLYFGVLCAETNMQALTAETTTQTPSPAVWKNDNIEIFLDTLNDCESYFQIGIDVAGQTMMHRWLSPNRKDAAFNAREIEAAVRKQEGQWIVEARIPFAVLGGAPSPAARWGVNMVRNRPPKGGETEQRYGWFSNPKGLYHVPEDFGRIAW
ncbi:MAG: DUF4838 domain-containing protein [Kiritimatiellae bacterium]|nr:DUF4838 domain-containing protein [Kiritimatiellia bacterium]